MTWLLLVLRLPAKPAYLRVKAWRRLQEIGAVVLKNAIYALPDSDASLNEFSAILKQVKTGGGSGVIFKSQTIAGLSDNDIRKLFNESRNLDYERIAAGLKTMKSARRSGEFRLKIAKARKEFSRARKIDFFGASSQASVETLLTRLEHSFIEETNAAPNPSRPEKPANLTGKTWVTRQGIHVDRIACSWLIRRFIDPKARLKFVPEKRYFPLDGELRFDMAGAEFTHEGDKCSFEVLLDAIKNTDPALSAIGQVIHNLDIRDEKFSRPEANGIGHVIEGICISQAGDLDRLARGGALLDDIYERFRRSAG